MPAIEQVEPYSLIPQWAIAVIVIGMASLLFVIVFGVAVVRQSKSGSSRPTGTAGTLSDGKPKSNTCVFLWQLVNRQRRSLKKQPQPLTADMLNELNKNHMGGVENYGQEELYNQEDTWSDNKLAIKQKVSALDFIFFMNITDYHPHRAWFSASPTPRTAAARTSTTAGVRSIGARRRRPAHRRMAAVRSSTTTTMRTTIRRRRPAIRRRCRPIRTA